MTGMQGLSGLNTNKSSNPTAAASMNAESRMQSNARATALKEVVKPTKPHTSGYFHFMGTKQDALKSLVTYAEAHNNTMPKNKHSNPGGWLERGPGMPSYQTVVKLFGSYAEATKLVMAEINREQQQQLSRQLAAPVPREREQAPTRIRSQEETARQMQELANKSSMDLGRSVFEPIKTTPQFIDNGVMGWVPDGHNAIFTTEAEALKVGPSTKVYRYSTAVEYTKARKQTILAKLTPEEIKFLGLDQ